MITKKTLKPINMGFLHNKNTLYTVDFRVIGESMDYEIPAMWKYENLLPWIINAQNITVNEDNKKLAYPFYNNLVVVPKGKTSNSKVSIYERLQQQGIDSKISKLWVAVPHPEADILAQQRGFILNYYYGDFLKRNDKFEQKKLLAELTPTWKIIQSQSDLLLLFDGNQKGFIKRRCGSGGFTVFDITNIKENKKFLSLFQDDPLNWYFEQFICGKSYSIQCVKGARGEVKIFGFSEQQIAENKYFIGSKILDLNDLSEKIFNKLKQGINQLKPLLENYEGFFGLDFILDKFKKVHILEANIRLTAVTIPTLFANMREVKKAIYMEDVKLSSIRANDIALAYDTHDSKANILKLFP